jgi:hypothetical protein
VISGHRVDPVAQLGAEPDQADPVPQQGAELADLRRGDPRPGQQVGAQQLRQDDGAGLVFSRAEAMALHRSGCTRCPLPNDLARSDALSWSWAIFNGRCAWVGLVCPSREAPGEAGLSLKIARITVYRAWVRLPMASAITSGRPTARTNYSDA